MHLVRWMRWMHLVHLMHLMRWMMAPVEGGLETADRRGVRCGL